MQQSKFCIVYANLSKVMSPIKVESTSEDGTTKRTSFYRLLLTRIQQEFERHGNNEQIVSIKYAITQEHSVKHAMCLCVCVWGGEITLRVAKLDESDF